MGAPLEGESTAVPLIQKHENATKLRDGLNVPCQPDDSLCVSSSEDSFSAQEAVESSDGGIAVEEEASTLTDSSFHGGLGSTKSVVPCFRSLRYTYLSVILVVFLADGLQGTHLYKLYDGYGFSVASLYCLGFFTGGVLSPITGPWIDKMGRKRAALLYCALEVFINTIEQYPYLSFLIASRVIGGLTTNLLHCVFETWLDCEFRKKKDLQLRQTRDHEEREAIHKAYQHAYEILMRDAVIISNSAAICSGFLSHVLAQLSGPVGPFRGAVFCTAVALVVVASLWTENYGGGHSDESDPDSDLSVKTVNSPSMFQFLKEAVHAFMADMRMLRVGIVQGFSVGSLQIFVYLWSPVLIGLAKKVPAERVATTWGLDAQGEPAFGLIFMLFMGACVMGGLIAPSLRQLATALLTPVVCNKSVPAEVTEGCVRPMAVEFLAATCYFVAACMLLVPCLVSGPSGFSRTICAFALYEFVVGIVSPCEGVIRSLYFPAHARASVWALPSLLVNTAVSLAVFSTQFVSMLRVLSCIVGLMMVASLLQISLITATEWAALKSHVKNTPKYARSLSFQVYEKSKAPPRKLVRFLSNVFQPSSFNEASSLTSVRCLLPPRAKAEKID